MELKFVEGIPPSLSAGALPCTSARLRPSDRVICAVGVTPPDSRHSRGASNSRLVVLLDTFSLGASASVTAGLTELIAPAAAGKRGHLSTAGASCGVAGTNWNPIKILAVE